MHFIRLIILKDLRRRLRAPVGLVSMLLMPLVLTAVIGLAFGPGGGEGPEIPRIRLLIADEDEGVAGRLLSGAFGQGQLAEMFEPLAVESGAEGRRQMEEGEASALLLIPPTFTDDLLSGRQTRLRVVRNPAESILPEVAVQTVEVLALVLTTGSRLLGQPLADLRGMVEGGEGGEAPTEAAVAALSVSIHQKMSVLGDYFFPLPVAVKEPGEEGEAAAEADGGTAAATAGEAAAEDAPAGAGETDIPGGGEGAAGTVAEAGPAAGDGQQQPTGEGTAIPETAGGHAAGAAGAGAVPGVTAGGGQQEPTGETTATPGTAAGEGASVAGKPIPSPMAAEKKGEPAGFNLFAVLLPGLSILGLLFVAEMAVRDVLAEQEAGTLARCLTTPLPLGRFLAGKLAQAFALCLACQLLLMLCGSLVFRVDWGPPLPVAAVTLATVLAVTGFAAFIFGVARNERQGGAVASLLIMGMSLLGGSMFPMELLPAYLRSAGRFTLNHWAIAAYRALAAEGGGWMEVLRPLLVLAAAGAGGIAAGAALLRRRLRAGLAG